MKEIVNEVEEEKYKNDYSFLLEYDKEALDEEIRQDELKKAREESYNEGIRNNKIEIAKKLLEKNISKEEIEKIIGMPLKKLEDPDYTNEIKTPTYDKDFLIKEIKNNKVEIAKKMLSKNINIEEIVEITGLTQEEVKKSNN